MNKVKENKKIEFKLASDSWDDKEIEAINRVVKSRKFSMGEEVSKLEAQFANYFGSKYCVMSNSGSSANLLAIAALVLSKKINVGDEVIVPAVSWSTTYFPLQQYGLKLKFVDVNLETLNYDVDILAEAITSETKLIVLVNLLGNNNDFDEIMNLISDKKIILFEDNCESMGSSYQGKMSGTFGVIGTFSSFYSHHIATMEGGYSITNDYDLYEYMKSLRAHGWTRDLSENSNLYKKDKNNFYEKFNFILPGYNLRPLEIEAAIAQEQLNKLDNIIANRIRNANYFKSKFADFKNLIIQKETGQSSWFGFSLILTGKVKGKRDVFIDYLESNFIEVRPIVAGNFTKNPVIDFFDYTIYGTLQNADYIHENGFFVGNDGKDLTREIDHLYNCISKVMVKFNAL
jgi:CDP-6-deoxy-D-xylo-4-hexulose-3-dehydrase